MCLEGCFHFGKVLGQCCNVAMFRVHHCGIATLSSLDCHVTYHVVSNLAFWVVSGETSVVAVAVVRLLTVTLTCTTLPSAVPGVRLCSPARTI